MASQVLTQQDRWGYEFSDTELGTPEDLVGSWEFVHRHRRWRDYQRFILPGDEGSPGHKILRPFGGARQVLPDDPGNTRDVNVVRFDHGATLLWVDSNVSAGWPPDPVPHVLQQRLDASLQFTVDAAHATLWRYDIISAKVEVGTDDKSEPRAFKDEDTGD